MTVSLDRTRVISTRDASEWREVLAIIDADPISNCFVASRLDRFRDDDFAPASWRVGGELWVHDSGNGIDSLAYSGANLVPVGVDSPTQVDAFVAYARRRGRRCSSIVGPANAVMAMWTGLESTWGPAREIRSNQPLLAISEPARLAGDPRVRALEPVDLDLLLPAAIAMFTEELGISPTGHDGGSTYRSRVAELLISGRAFARVEELDGKPRVIFKADIGAFTNQVSQIQGVWVHPDMRGQGIGTAGMAAVVDLALKKTPTVSLYVNDYNRAALRCYEKVGFAQVGTFASILF